MIQQSTIPFSFPVTGMKRVVFFLILSFFAQLSSASDFQKDTSVVGVQPVLKLLPDTNNPRNSEGDFITLKSGRILFVYTHYTGHSSSDHASAFLASRFSDDGGKTWSEEDGIVVQREGTMNVMSVSLLRLQNGRIALFYLRKNAINDCIPFVRFSDDEAKTWSEPISCINDQKGYFVLNNNRVIQLQNGRLLLAVALHQTPEINKWSNTGRLFSYYSDDNGLTWSSGKEVPNPDNVVTQEPGLVELKNGNIFMFIRTGSGYQYQSFSSDKGVSWSPAAATNIFSPLSPASIQRIPSTGDLLMVWNNNDGTNPQLKGKRTPLTIAISKDEGLTWEKIKNIENDPDGWYCYTAIHFNRKNLLLSYCAGSQRNKTHLSQTNLTRINLKWIYK